MNTAAGSTSHQAIARSLVYAVVYLNARDSESPEDDVGALESIAGYLTEAREEEKDTLAAAAEELFNGEKEAGQREEFLEAYGSWMENFFGEGWEGNKRSDAG
jgi:hypothetical protein